MISLETVANSVVRKSNTSVSLDVANDICKVGFGLGVKLGACLLNELFNVGADGNSSRRHALCAMGVRYSRAKCCNLKLNKMC